METPDLQLETVCPDCNGKGGYRDVEEETGWAECLGCGGSGFQPTPMGARILDLVRHNSRVQVSAEFCVSSMR